MRARARTGRGRSFRVSLREGSRAQMCVHCALRPRMWKLNKSMQILELNGIFGNRRATSQRSGAESHTHRRRRRMPYMSNANS